MRSYVRVKETGAVRGRRTMTAYEMGGYMEGLLPLIVDPTFCICIQHEKHLIEESIRFPLVLNPTQLCCISPTLQRTLFAIPTMTLNSHGDLAIVELIFYTPALALALWVAGRHGFGRQAGWIFLAVLILVRIIGSAMLLASEHKPSTALITGAAILDGVGISPLLLAMLGILKRMFGSLSSPSGYIRYRLS